MAVRRRSSRSPTHVHEDQHKHQKLVIIAWSGDLDKVWPQMILATTGAAMGMQTTIFFTFWDCSRSSRTGSITGDNWMQKMVSTMDRPGMEHLKLGKMNFAGAGPKMMKHLAKEHKVASPGELLEWPAISAFGWSVPDDDGPARAHARGHDRRPRRAVGATTMLLEAQDAVTLFI